MVFGYIVILKKSGSYGSQYPVKKSMKIGRGTHCDIRIHIQSVSEQHCLLLVEKGKRALIQNLSATSQTLVNGVSIGKGTHPLNHGDSIGVGGRSFQWQYSPQSTFYESSKVVQKRRKSEADSAVGSQNIAVVNPLFHKRRTLGPTTDSSRSAKLSGSPGDLKKKALKASSDLESTAKFPTTSNSPASKTPIKRFSLGKTPQSSPKAKTPAARSATRSLKSPLAKSPARKSSLAKSPARKSFLAKSPALKSPVAKSPALKSPVAKSPARKSPVAKSPALKSPVAKSPPLKSPVAKSPALKSPVAKSPALKSPVAKSPALKSPVAKSPALKSPVAKSPARKSSLAKSPALKSPVAKSSAHKSPVAKSPARKSSLAKSPALKSPVAKSPARKSPVAKSPAHKSPVAKSPALKSPVVKSPALKSPVAKSSARKSSLVKTPARRFSLAKSPALKSPVAKSPARRSSLAKSPTGKSPAAKSSILKSPVAKSPARKSSTVKSPALKSPLSKSLAVKSPVAKSPARKVSMLKTPAKSPAVQSPTLKSRVSKTPANTSTAKKSSNVQSASRRKSQSAVKSAKSVKGLKRRLSSPAPVAAKRLKIESPKSIDKKKMAVLMGIHGKASRAAASSTLSTVKVVLSAKRTPVIKAIKTPRSSTVKKGSVVKSSVKKARRPLFSDILKKAVKRAIAVDKKVALVPKVAPKPIAKKVETKVHSLEIPERFKFGSTGHANSPDTIFIRKKVTKTPVVTKKGRKAPLLIAHHTENINLSGVNEMFLTPAKVTSPSQLNQQLSAEASSSSSSKTSRLSRKTPKTIASESPSKSLSSSKRLSSSQHGLFEVKKTPIKSTSPVETPVNVNLSGTSSSRSTPHGKISNSIGRRSLSVSVSMLDEKLTVKTPQSTSKSKSVSKKPLLLTSTPAVLGKRQSLAESAFESPSSLLTGPIGTPQSPASGRKSRFEMVVSRTSYVHSPHASPVKSSLKSSPSKSPPSGGHGKSLSVSFNDSINIQLLVPGTSKSLNTTAPLSSPISPRSEGHSGAATPDLTTFDFNSVKTPNVPREMFVSSILSSGTSSSGLTSGSAKRKGKTVKQNDVTHLHGVRRLLKTPTSPAGYVDVKGVKRLMTAACKTPTYLAVEGVKKLFGDAVAAAGNELSSFAGVRELFASPSPIKAKAGGRVSLKESPKTTPRKASPVAKIQAEVETKGRSSVSTPKAARDLKPLTSPSESKNKKSKVSLVQASARSSTSPASPSSERISGPLSPKLKGASSPTSSTKVSERKVLPRRGRAGGRKGQPSKSTETVEDARVSSPKTSVQMSISLESPPKRKTRRAAKVSTPVPQSPVEELPKTRIRRGAKGSSSPKVELPSRATKKATRAAPGTIKASPSKSPTPVKSPVKATSKKTAARKKLIVKTPSPAKSPPIKRTTRRGAKASTASPLQPKGSKRVLSPSKEELESPAKKPKKETLSKSTPASGSTNKKATPKAQSKRKAVTFVDEVVTPQKRSKTVASKTSGSPTTSSDAEPVTNKRTKRPAASKKTVQPTKDASPSRKTKAAKKTSSPVLTVSPRRTRSRK